MNTEAQEYHVTKPEVAQEMITNIQDILEGSTVYCADTCKDEPLSNAIGRIDQDWLDQNSCQQTTIDLAKAMRLINQIAFEDLEEKEGAIRPGA